MSVKKIFAGILIFTMILMVGCSSGGGETADVTEDADTTADVKENAETTVLRLAIPDGPDGFMSNAVQEFADELYERTDGQYSIEIGWSGAFGSVAEYFDLVKDGVVDFGFFLPTVTPGVFPLCSIMDLPWYFPDAEISSTALMTLYEEGYLNDSELEAVQILFLNTGDGANIYSVKENCTTLADFEGQRIVAIGDMMISTAEALNMSPSFYEHSEHYSVFQKNVMDANFSPWDGIITYNLQEVLNSCLETKISSSITGLMMNKDVFESMPEEVQQIIYKLSDEVLIPRTLESRASISEESRQAFIDAGGTVSEVSDEDLAAMNEALAPLWDSWLEEMGEDGKAAVEAMYQIMLDQGVENPAVGYTP